MSKHVVWVFFGLIVASHHLIEAGGWWFEPVAVCGRGWGERRQVVGCGVEKG